MSFSFACMSKLKDLQKYNQLTQTSQSMPKLVTKVNLHHSIKIFNSMRFLYAPRLNFLRQFPHRVLSNTIVKVLEKLDNFFALFKRICSKKSSVLGRPVFNTKTTLYLLVFEFLHVLNNIKLLPSLRKIYHAVRQ